MKDDAFVTVQESGLRDGLQSIARTLPTADKKRWIDLAFAAGIRHMEVASFVPPRLLPQMADADEVVAHALTHPGLVVTALVPNLRGAQNALAAQVHRVTAPISVSHAHSMANVRKPPVAAVEEFQRIRGLIDEAGQRVTLIAGLSTVFGCTYQGDVPLADVVDIVQRVADAGCDAIALGDTTGYATPAQVARVLQAVRRVLPQMPLIGHFHDTRSLGLANTIVALQHGIREFDACLGGLGGCPFATGATGNVATEDLVFMLESMGHPTGIDLPALLASRSLLEETLPGEPLSGGIARAGLPKNFQPAAAAIA